MALGAASTDKVIVRLLASVAVRLVGLSAKVYFELAAVYDVSVASPFLALTR